MNLNEIWIWIFYNTALHLAVEKGDSEIVQTLLAHHSVKVNIESIKKHLFFSYHSTD